MAADESLYAVAGTSRLPDAGTPTMALASILADPAGWSDRPLIYLPWQPLRQRLSMPKTDATTNLTLHQVERHRELLQATMERKAELDRSGRKGPWSADDEATATLANRFAETLSVVSGRTLFIAPLATSNEERSWLLTAVRPALPEAHPGERAWQSALREANDGTALKQADVWLTWEDVVRDPDPLLNVAGAPPRFAALVTALRQPESTATRDLLYAGFTARDLDLASHRHNPGPSVIAAELVMQRARPFTWAWILFILGGLVAAWGLGQRTWAWRAGVAAIAAGIMATCAGLTIRTVITGLGAVTNLYETLIYVGLVVAVLGVGLARWSGNRLYVAAAGVGAGLSAMIGEAMPPDLGSHIGQLQPVLRSKFWLWIHVKVVVAAYAPLLLALMLGNIVMWQAWRQRRHVTADEGHTLYRCLQWGVALMAAGTLLGAVWADQAWGRFWGWDPKEVGALMIILTYLIPLHLRYVGNVGPTGLAAWSVLGFLSVVWSWYGVNFILGAGLHAYAFGSGGQEIVLPLAAIQTVWTVFVLLRIHRATRRASLPLQ